MQGRILYKGFRTIVFVIVLLFSNHYLCSQTIDSVHYYQKGENLVIKYHLINSKPGTEYKVWMHINQDTGRVKAHALSGDVGKGVKGGKNKEILWNMAADHIYSTVGLELEIFAIPLDALNEQTTDSAVDTANMQIEMPLFSQ